MYRLLILAVALPFLVAIDLAGRRANLTRNPAWDSSPAVARDGRVVFLSTRDGAADFLDGDGRNVRRLTVGQGVWNEALDISQASWSPRAARIAFDSLGAPPTPGCLQHCANLDVRVIDADGSGLKQVAVRARAPSWSRDGRRLAYAGAVGAEGTAAGVTITRLDGSGSVHVEAFHGFSSVGPAWSPTRDEIAFQARPADASSSSIYVVGADGRRKRRLAVGHDPAWSRDGSRLAFIDDYKLFTIGRNGKGKRRLSRKGEFVVGAAWSPRARHARLRRGHDGPSLRRHAEEPSGRDRERGRKASTCPRARVCRLPRLGASRLDAGRKAHHPRRSRLTNFVPSKRGRRPRCVTATSPGCDSSL